MANVGYATLRIIPSAKGFQSGLNRQVSGSVAGVAGRAGSDAGKASSRRFGATFVPGLKSIAGPVAALFGARVVGNFVKSAVSAASDLTEAGTKTREIFGSATGQINAFAASGAKNLGQSKLSILDAAGTFGIFGKAAGLAGQENAAFSKKLVGLSTDLASFSNTTPEQAIEAIGAALRGESEPIRSYGVLLDDATLRQRAMKLGITDTVKKALTPQQRVLAANAEIFAQTSTAQGDFARTSGGLANQQRILAAQWTNTKASLGAVFLPLATKVFTLLNAGLGPAVSGASRAVGALRGAFSGAGSGGSRFSGILGQLVGFARSLVPIFKSAFGSIRSAVSGLTGPIKSQLLPAIQTILPVLAPVARFLVSVFAGSVVGAIRGVVKVVTGLIGVFSGIVDVVAGIFTGDWPRVWEGFKSIVSGAFTAVIGLIQTYLNIGVLGLFRRGFALIKTIVTAGWTAVRSLFSGSLAAIGGAMGRVVSIVTAPFRAAFGAVRGFVSTGWSYVRGAFSGGVGGVRAVLGRLLEVVTYPFRAAFNGARSLVSAGWSRIRSLFSGGTGGVRGVLSGLLSIVTAPFRLAMSAAQRLTSGGFTALASAARTGVGKLGDVVRTIPGKVKDGIGDLGGLLSSAGRAIVEGLIRGIEQMIGKLKAKLGALTKLIPKNKGPLPVDKRLLVPNGQAIMEGLIAGFDSRLPAVRSGLAGITREIGRADFASIQAAENERIASITRRSAGASGSSRGGDRDPVVTREQHFHAHGIDDPAHYSRAAARYMATRSV